jgi:Family of unknown function (DUF6113)
VEETYDPRNLATGGAYGALVAFGVVLGLVGSFQFSWEFGGVPVAAILLTALNFAFFRAAGWAMAAKLGTVAVVVPWLIMVILLSSPRAEGDLIVTGTSAGWVFILGGAAAAALAIAWAPSPGRPPEPGGDPPLATGTG